LPRVHGLIVFDEVRQLELARQGSISCQGCHRAGRRGIPLSSAGYGARVSEGHRGSAEAGSHSGYDRLLEIGLRYDVALSLGDGMRPRSLAHGTDRCQMEELVTMGELVGWARGADDGGRAGTRASGSDRGQCPTGGTSLLGGRPSTCWAS
jgi:hypothetical protein